MQRTLSFYGYAGFGKEIHLYPVYKVDGKHVPDYADVRAVFPNTRKGMKAAGDHSLEMNQALYPTR